MGEWHVIGEPGDHIAGSVGGIFQPLDQLSSLPASLIVCAANGTILSATQRALTTLRLERESALGANIRDLFGVPVDAVRDQPMGGTIEIGTPPDTRHIELECRLGYLPGIPGAALTLTAQDVTEHVATSAERDRLMRIAVVGEILPGVLHEVRNPLAAVRTMTELLIEEHPGTQLQEDLHSMLHELRRIQATLQGIGSIGHTLVTQSAAAVDLSIEEAARSLAASAAENQIELVARVDAMPLLCFDTTVIRGIVFNLVRNSIDACDPGSRIEVVAGFDGRRLDLCVSDDGPGMTDEIAHRASRLFFSTKEHGSGIGLALVRRSVESADGRFDIETAPGAGTRITLSIPVPPHPNDRRSTHVTHRESQ